MLGFVYAVLAVRRNRWCWVAGGISCAIFVYLALRARLPMQSLLQTYYVLMSFYGWWHWSRANRRAAHRRVAAPLAPGCGEHVPGREPAARARARHGDAGGVAVPRFVRHCPQPGGHVSGSAREGGELGVLFVVDCMLVFLFVAQGLVFSACLFASYLVISVVGFVTWLRRLRQQTPVSTPAPA